MIYVSALVFYRVLVGIHELISILQLIMEIPMVFSLILSMAFDFYIAPKCF